MRLWSYQHPAVLQTLQQGERYVGDWEGIYGERWQAAYRWMVRQMADRGIPIGEHAPVWAWHSVNRIGGKPDELCARALLSDVQLEEGRVVLELQVPDPLVLTSGYGPWNNILYGFLDDTMPVEQDVMDCFNVSLRSRRGRPPRYFPEIQACLPWIDPVWLVAWETLDVEAMLEKYRVLYEEGRQSMELQKLIVLV